MKTRYGGHFTFLQPRLLLRRASGEALFEVQDCEDIKTNEKWAKALVTVHVNGSWEAGSTPWGAYRSATGRAKRLAHHEKVLKIRYQGRGRREIARELKMRRTQVGNPNYKVSSPTVQDREAPQDEKIVRQT